MTPPGDTAATDEKGAEMSETAEPSTLISYLQSSLHAHPDLDDRALLARAVYVFEAGGFEQVRRAARVELGDWPGAESE